MTKVSELIDGLPLDDVTLWHNHRAMIKTTISHYEFKEIVNLVTDKIKIPARIAAEEERLIQTLAALIRKMSYRMCKPHLPGNGKIAKEAMEFLAEYGLQGSILRDQTDKEEEV